MPLRISSQQQALTPYYTGFECAAIKSVWNIPDSCSSNVYVSDDGQPHKGFQQLLVNSSSNQYINHIDLNVDLSAISDPILSFAWKDYDSTSQVGDGVWLSDNDGLTFTKGTFIECPMTPSGKIQRFTFKTLRILMGLY